MKHPALLLTALLCAATGAHAAKPLINVPLVWKPTTQISIPVEQNPTALIQVLPLTNSSDNPTLIAENREDPKPKPVTTSDDVGKFTATQMQFVLKQFGWKVTDQSPDLILSGEVQRFFVAETDTYDASVVLHITAKTPEGKVVWDGTTSGSAKRFGRSYKLENYYEVLSDSIIDATSALARSPDFHNAVMKAGH